MAVITGIQQELHKSQVEEAKKISKVFRYAYLANKRVAVFV